MTKIDFRKQIQRELKARGMSVPQLVTAIQKKYKDAPNQGTLYRYLQGRTELTTGILERVLNTLNSA
jgi:hypothetical protein